MTIRLQVAILVYMMLGAVLSGFAIVVVLLKPHLAGHAPPFIAAAVVASLVIAAPLSWSIARRLIARLSRVHLHDEGHG